MDSLLTGAMNQPTAFALILMGVVVGAVVALLTLGIMLGMKGVAMQRARLMTPPEVPPMPKPPNLDRVDSALEMASGLASMIAGRVMRVLLERLEADDLDTRRFVYVVTLGRVEVMAFYTLHALGGELAEPIKMNHDGTLNSVQGVLIEESGGHSEVQVSVQPRMRVVGG